MASSSCARRPVSGASWFDEKFTRGKGEDDEHLPVRIACGMKPAATLLQGRSAPDGTGMVT
jgi:hypothetical protein